MIISRTGKVIKPYQYRNWRVEVTGDSDTTGGFHLFIFSPGNKKDDHCYWDVSEDLVHKQLEQEYIEIQWD